MAEEIKSRDRSAAKIAHDLPPEEKEEINSGVNGATQEKKIRKTADICVDEENVNFESLALSEPILKGLSRAGFRRPSPVQLQAIPIGRCGSDMVVQAKAGTGKTCVFTVLALESVVATNPAAQAIIIAPTREIAMQINHTLMGIGYYLITNDSTNTSNECPIKIACFIGGTKIQLDKEKSKLQQCQIIVGTPGRIWQLVNEGDLSLDAVRLFVLDEADKLMEDSYLKDINSIYARLPSSKQLVVLSATYPRQLDEFLTRYMVTPQIIKVDHTDVQLIGIKQYIISFEIDRNVNEQQLENQMWLIKKVEFLHRLLSRVPFKQCLIFCNFQDKAEIVCEKLRLIHKWPAEYISASLTQHNRLTVMQRLKTFKIRVLVSTDLTARGIDAQNVDLVINFDLPNNVETYFHRIGRAGRFGGYGAAITLLSRKMDEYQFFNMLIGNCLRVKRLESVDTIPADLVDNEDYFRQLPALELPDEKTLRLELQKREKYLKRKQQKYQDQHQRLNGKDVTPVSEDDSYDYMRLIKHLQPIERWSPDEFKWEDCISEVEASENALSQKTDSKTTGGISYSREAMLDIMMGKEPKIQSKPDEISTEENGSILIGQKITVQDLFSKFSDEKSSAYDRDFMLRIRSINEDVSDARTVSILENLGIDKKGEKSIEKPSICGSIFEKLGFNKKPDEKPVSNGSIFEKLGIVQTEPVEPKSIKNDLEDLLKKLKENSEKKPEKASTESKAKRDQPRKSTFFPDEFLDQEKQIDRRYAENELFENENREEIREEKKKISYTGDQLKKIRSKIDRAYAENLFGPAAMQKDPFITVRPDKKRKQKNKNNDKRGDPKPAAVSATDPEKTEAEKPEKPFTKSEYFQAVSNAKTSPFNVFYASWILDLQAASVEAQQKKTKIETRNIEIQTEKEEKVQIDTSISTGKNIIAYNKNQLLAIWKVVAENADWSTDRVSKYGWANVMQENGIFVQREFIAKIEESPVHENDEKLEEEEEEMAGSKTVQEYQCALRQYGELVKEYRRMLASKKSSGASDGRSYFRKFEKYEKYLEKMLEDRSSEDGDDEDEEEGEEEKEEE